ncbi:MAG: dGTP triphosphohydrolase, partial [Alphaproteobacteria bacterium]
MPLAPYATRGTPWERRLRPETLSAGRSPFQHDRDRIVHATAFRRLMHKTQVFVAFEGDHYRTRLTHSLEVAQIARSLARRLGLDEDLTEALALAHDLGHTPFGHAGEDALHECMKPFGGFDHNAQTLRVLTRLEQRYAAFDGLNLTVATLDGLLKHNGPLGPRDAWPFGIAEIADATAIDPARQGVLEAQIAALADDIAYDTHDVDDGLRAGLFRIEDLRPVPLIGACVDEVLAAYPGLDPRRLIHESLRRLIGRMVDDLLAETGQRIA